MLKRKALIIVSVVVACAVVGAIIGAVIALNKSPKDSTNKTADANPSAASTSGPSTTSSKSTSKKSTSTNSTNKNSTTDTSSSGSDSVTLSSPDDAKYTVTALAIGDWGQTVSGDSCCSRGGRPGSNLDKHAMVYTADLLAAAAKSLDPKPSVIIGHGDNFYWTGINGKSDQQTRFETTFEKTYSDPALSGIPWVNVMGNHDYGGASFVCSSGGQNSECTDSDALVAGIKEKFDLQASYKSPNNDRWKLTDHYYVHSISDDASGVSVDIFNLDTNDADVHAAQQICCQCYGYSKGDPDKKCNSVAPGDKFCANGDKDMYDSCMKLFNDWGQESRDKLVADVKKSKATWKIVNSHYGPYDHYSEKNAAMWKELLSDLDVQLFIYGHTHGEKHDFASFNMHFIENGAGGGIQSEAPSGIPPYAEDYVKNVWSGTNNYPYGIFELSASKDWLKARFLTFDSKWNFAEDVSSTTVGGLESDHCWLIPRDGKEGQKCSS